MATILKTPSAWPQVLLDRKAASQAWDDPAAALDGAVKRGAFEGLKRCVHELGPAGTIATIAASGLRGRGGGGFPTGEKWRIAARDRSPAALRRRERLRRGPVGRRPTGRSWSRNPFAVVEGVAIAAFSIGATEAFIAVRAEATEAIRRLEGAIAAAEDAGFVGPSVLGSGRSVTITVRPVQGAYMLGEETVLLKALEGKRGQPEQRPPYPAEVGLFDRPTVVQNVQTLAAVPWILVNGAEAFAAIGVEGEPRHDPRPGPRRRAATASRRSRWGRRSATSSSSAGGGERTLKAVLVGGPVGRAAAGRPARHAVRVRRAARGRGPRRVGLDRRRRRAGLRRRPRPAPDPLLRRRGVRQDDPVPDRDAADQRDRRPDRDRRPAPDGPPAAGRPVGRRRRVAPCATTSVWRRFRTHPGCDTSGASSTSTSSAAPAQPASADRSPSRPGPRASPRTRDGRPDHPPGPARADGARAARRHRSPSACSTTQSPQRPQSTPRIRIEVDGRVVEGFEGQTILEVCRDNGIEIPTLCYEPKLPGFGACRMCVVEVEGEEHPPISCSRACRAGHGRPDPDRRDPPAPPDEPRADLQRPQRLLPAALPEQVPQPHRHPGLPQGERRGELARVDPHLQADDPVPVASSGRVCPAPCEEHCRRDEVDEAIAIRDSPPLRRRPGPQGDARRRASTRRCRSRSSRRPAGGPRSSAPGRPAWPPPTTC